MTTTCPDVGKFNANIWVFLDIARIYSTDSVKEKKGRSESFTSPFFLHLVLWLSSSNRATCIRVIGVVNHACPVLSLGNINVGRPRANQFF